MPLKSHLSGYRAASGTCEAVPGGDADRADKRTIGDAIKRTRERLLKVKRQRSTQPPA